MGSERRLRLFIYARIVVTFLFLAVTQILGFQNVSPLERLQPGVFQLVLFSFLFSLFSLFALKRRNITPFLTNLQVIWDLLFVTVLILFTGGISSPYSFLYLLSILIAGMLLGRRQSLYTASLCGILYGTILDFQYFGYLSSIGLGQDEARQTGALTLFYTIAFNISAFGLTAFITGLLAERARLSEEALQQSTIDYSELAQLNSAIVTHSESGLMTTTVTGRIRVCNPYAEAIIGLRQSDAYDRQITSIFPQLSGYFSPDRDTRLEFDYRSPSGVAMTLEYHGAPFSDTAGKLTGYIVNFNNITDLRRMEAALKKADRLAAVGELSARMSHEIRNPLAALCGAVQLLAGAPDIRDNDARLLAIVTREAERLNLLISEFLLYARPATPRPEMVQLRPCIEEELLFLANDPRFAQVSMRNLVPETTRIPVDRNQLSQVIINLMQNAAEAMVDGGDICIDCTVTPEQASISITDNGPGISEEAARNLFEPFWTTKPSGTGLGLAVSYRIIEAHGGSLSVESVSGGGCRFIISLPV